jgi:serine protease Do
VTSVSATGPAYNRLQERDIITEIVNPGPRREIRTVADLDRVLSGLKAGDYISVVVLRSAVNYQETQVVNIQVN